MKMTDVELAYKMRTLFDQKITAFYFESYKGSFGRVQVDVLSYLYEHGNSNAVQLSEIMNVPKQHISKIVHRLEEDGLLESKIDATDKRSKSLFLSAKGRALVLEHIEISNIHFQSVTNCLQNDDREELHRSMETIIKIMNKI